MTKTSAAAAKRPRATRRSGVHTAAPAGTTLHEIGNGLIAPVLTAACDLALLIDANGLIADLQISGDTLAHELSPDWHGRAWVDAVVDDSQSKAVALLAAARANEAPRWRQLNLRLGPSGSLPMGCTAVALANADGGERQVLVLARDERTTAALQQRLIEAQLSVERDYARFRQAELRYRHLFQLAAEAMLVIDTGSSKVTEVNPAAAELMGLPADKLLGQPITAGLAPRSHKAVEAMLAGARRNARGEPVQARLATGGREVRLTAALFNQDNTSLLLVRMGGAATAASRAADTDASLLLLLARQAPDALVITDPQGQVLACNQAFAQLTQLDAPELATGQSLERWLGRSGVDLGVLLSNLRQGGSVKLFATTLRDELGVSTEVEISAVAASAGDGPVMGFAVRDVGRRLSAETSPARVLPGSVNQLAELVGRVPMKDIVSETSDLIEKLCIEAALELTRDNRASAAEILGLSRQSLYVKLRRYGLGDLGPATDK